MSSFLIKNKSEKSFESKISKLARKTQESIRASNKSFARFCLEYYDQRTSQDIFDEINTLKDKEKNQAIREVLQNWIDWQYEKGSLTSGVRQYVSKIKRLFSHNGILIHESDFEEKLEYKPTIKEELHELTLEEIQNILKFANPKKIGFYLALSCTGARPGELLQVRKKDIDTSKKRIKIRIEAENVKTRSGRSIWLSKEAGSYLMVKLKNLRDEDLVWAKHENFSFAEKNESSIFSKVCDKAGYTDRYKSNGNRKITLYSFRSYFFGKASDTHREGYAHKMIGHGGYLPQYDRMSDEKKLEWYLQLEPELVIDSTKRNQLEIKRLEAEKSELEETKIQRDNLLKRVKRLEELGAISGQEMELMSKKKHITIEELQEQMQEQMANMAKAIQELKKE
ncbi:integrase family protein [Marine Group I thaumarchaeote SCGC AAA799-E16]|uniref:Integrase family protein n=2 Tax=Marine Group I TaxID=905826 RepID=A0A087RXV8_9ARCH|nr:integrase family protein [Marine Group I thaumarchaeote SCGC AAA799-E16]KFM18312.1 integrase family protein [Marine Group I thaumarchaeote SCGC RSA3]